MHKSNKPHRKSVRQWRNCPKCRVALLRLFGCWRSTDAYITQKLIVLSRTPWQGHRHAILIDQSSGPGKKCHKATLPKGRTQVLHPHFQSKRTTITPTKYRRRRNKTWRPSASSVLRALLVHLVQTARRKANTEREVVQHHLGNAILVIFARLLSGGEGLTALGHCAMHVGCITRNCSGKGRR